jgi:hypothetical protein
MAKFIFGVDIKRQVAARIQAHIATNFGNNSAEAAKDLNISRQRLFSYTSATTLPRPPMFDLFLQKWGLDLLGKSSQSGNAALIAAVPIQRGLFDKPITLKGSGMKVVIKRQGSCVVASIEISTEVKIA